MANIKTVFKNINEMTKSKFCMAQSLLTISVGQETHEDTRFAATIDLISRSFSSCTIALHDSLQRYTMALGQKQNADYFHDAAVFLGERWLERNEKYYKNFQKPLRIIRWDEWLNDKDFSEKRTRIMQTINSDTSYQRAFDETIDEYLTRYSRRLTDNSEFNLKRARQLCFDYLVEECAVLCLWPKTGCHFEVYAGNHNAAMKATRVRFVDPVYPELVKSISIGFNHRPDLRPQNFNFSNVYLYNRKHEIMRKVK